MKFHFLLLCGIFTCLSSLFSPDAWAQSNQVIRGSITDQSGEPLIGVSVSLKGSTIGTVTDFDGNFTLNTTQEAATLVVSYVGYTSQEILANSRTPVRIVLKEDTQILDEIVVVAYGTQRKKDLTGAISVIDTKAIEKQLSPGIGQALQGLATGVSVTTSGTPGSGADIIIRGIGSFNTVQPLYVVDGMILESSQREINMHDVESVQVLKDASATTLYGSRGANGVILITTKRGHDGPTQIRFSTSLGISQIAKRYDMMNSIDFLRINRLSYENAGKPWPGEPAQGQELVNTDWQDAFYKTGITQDYNLSVSGGNPNGKYMMSFDYYDEDGVVVGPSHRRMTVRANSEGKKGIFTIGENFTIGRSETKTLEGSPFIEMVRMPPIIPIYDSNNESGYGYGSDDYPTYAINPVGLQETHDNRQYNLRIIGSAYLQIEPIKDLKIKTNLGVEYFNWYDRYRSIYKQLRYKTPPGDYKNELYEGNGDMQSWMWENTAVYSKNIKEHEFDLLAGYSAQKIERRGNDISGYNMLQDDFWVLKQFSKEDGKSYRANGSMNTTAMTSIFGRVNYKYSDRYLTQFNIRRDATSLFGPNYRNALFYSVSAGWRINNESFMQSIDWIDDLKLRASYGISGNQKAVEPYQFASYIVSGDRVGIYGQKPTIYPGQIQNGRSNSDLRWEKRATTNIGVDFILLDQKLYGSLEWFHADLNDLLIRKTLPWVSGTDVNPWINFGRLSNKGLEFQIGYRETKAEFQYDISLNLSGTRNKIKRLSDNDFYYSGIDETSNSVVGRSMGEFFVLRTDGIFQNWDEVYAHSKTIVDPQTGIEKTALIQPNAAPGDIRYKDLNNDGAITEGDREFAGSPFPDLEGGLNLSFSYKNFDLNLFFYGVYGNMIYNNNKRWLEMMTEPHNMVKGFTPWTGEGTSNTTPRPYSGQTDNTLSYTDRWLEKGDYIRLKNLQLGYTVPKTLLKETKMIETLRLYAGVQNLFTITGYSGLDPEVSGGGLFSKGYDDGHFPPFRMFTFGLQVSF